LFAKMVCKLHGMPKSIVSDRDPIFMSNFWQDLFRLSGTKLRMSSAYHPQTDGQTEIVNKALQQYLRCFVHQQPKEWGKYLHWAEWHYNTSIHSATGMSPFQVVYGKLPPTLPAYIAGSSRLEAVETELSSREDILELLKKKLQKAQESMKNSADKKRLPHNFKQGDWAFVKLRPHRQVSVAGHRVNKLAKRYYGPFKLLRAIGEVAFELELPASSRIHPIFHVSQLKPCVSEAISGADLPPNSVDNCPVIQPLAILQHDNEGDPDRVLVQWQGLMPEDATWESLADIRKSYPNLNLEDKVFVDGGRDVTGSQPLMDFDNGPEDTIGPMDPGLGTRARKPPGWMKDFVSG
jgi:hypothetical protein